MDMCICIMCPGEQDILISKNKTMIDACEPKMGQHIKLIDFSDMVLCVFQKKDNIYIDVMQLCPYKDRWEKPNIKLSMNKNTSQNMKLVLIVIYKVGNDGIHKIIILKQTKKLTPKITNRKSNLYRNKIIQKLTLKN